MLGGCFSALLPFPAGRGLLLVMGDAGLHVFGELVVLLLEHCCVRPSADEGEDGEDADRHEQQLRRLVRARVWAVPRSHVGVGVLEILQLRLLVHVVGGIVSVDDGVHVVVDAGGGTAGSPKNVRYVARTV